MSNPNDTVPGGMYMEMRGGREVFVNCNGEEIGAAPVLTPEQSEIAAFKQRIDELTAQIVDLTSQNAELAAKMPPADVTVSAPTAKPPKQPAQAPIVAP